MDINTIRERLIYFPETGRLVWRKGNGRRSWSGRPVLTQRVMLDKELVQTSHVAYAHFHGEWPSGYLRFKDGNSRNHAAANMEQRK